MAGKILVLGSSNVDTILRVPRFPAAGETIRAESRVTAFGGKGANQAVAAKRLGGNVIFITKMGNDSYGQSYRKYLIQSGLDPKGILLEKKAPTGMALIELTPSGENRIIISPGANGALTSKDLGRFSALWKSIAIFVTQMETPLPTVQFALKMAKRHGALTLFNPAPAGPIPPEILSDVDVLVPNETEAQILTGMPMRTEADLSKMAQELLNRGAQNVVITLGSRGLFFQNKTEELRFPALRVKVVDSTGAGDAFVGALACGLADGKALSAALVTANAAGALACTKLGAQPSLPRKRELERFLRGKAGGA